MISVDTHVLVRYIVKDDECQAEEATAFLSSNPCLVLHTVLLEVVWVLSSKTGYNWERSAIVERIRPISGLPTLFAQPSESISQALVCYESGMDFADALHVASGGKQSNFATFDRRLHTKAKQLQLSQTVILLGDDTR